MAHAQAIQGHQTAHRDQGQHQQNAQDPKHHLEETAQAAAGAGLFFLRLQVVGQAQILHEGVVTVFIGFFPRGSQIKIDPAFRGFLRRLRSGGFSGSTWNTC